MKKTNALRMLDRVGVAYRTAEYDTGGEAVEAIVVARKIGMPPEQVFKTLVASGPGQEYFVFVVPGDCELDLKKAAAAATVKKIDLIPVRELQPLTGYIRGGCSPLGMKRNLPTYVDETCDLYDEIATSAGLIGLQVILQPIDLVAAVKAHLADLV